VAITPTVEPGIHIKKITYLSSFIYEIYHHFCYFITFPVCFCFRIIPTSLCAPMSEQLKPTCSANSNSVLCIWALYAMKLMYDGSVSTAGRVQHRPHVQANTLSSLAESCTVIKFSLNLQQLCLHRSLNKNKKLNYKLNAEWSLRYSNVNTSNVHANVSLPVVTITKYLPASCHRL